MARPTTTPSSSSLPAEAIEAEVQRQLGGLLGRLQQAEERNAMLENEIEMMRRGCGDRPPTHTSGAVGPIMEQGEPTRLLGDLAVGPMGPSLPWVGHELSQHA